jgi:membrane-associated protease RseP (regulator of RpoE activity)
MSAGRTIILFFLFLGLTIILHETGHLLVARWLGYSANVYYGFLFPNIYGYVTVEPPVTNPLHALLIYCAGGIGAGTVMLILWLTVVDPVVQHLMSFFSVNQLSYGILEPLYGFGLVPKSVLENIPVVTGIIGLMLFRLIYIRRYQRRLI